MPDREKVLKGLDICANGSGCKDGIPNPCCPYASEIGCDLNQILLDALALLKEQNDCENCAIAIEDRQPVVRCKDCKYAFQHWNDLYRCDNHCNHLNGYGEHHGHWYCADGERRSE